MEATNVYTALNDAIEQASDTIDLWTAATGSVYLQPMEAILQLFGITGPYILTGAALSQLGNTVTLTGNGMFGQPGATAANQYAIFAKLYFVDNGSTDGVFTLDFRFVSTNWSFSYFFHNLPQSRIYSSASGGPVWAESFLTGLLLQSLTFSGTNLEIINLQVSGYLPYNLLFAPYTGFVPTWPLRVSGTLQMPASWDDYPLMELVALAGPGSDMTLVNNMPFGVVGNGPVCTITNVGLRLSIANIINTELWERPAFSTLYLTGHLSLGSLQADLSAPLLTSEKIWNLSVVFDPATASFVDGLSQLTTLFGMPELPLPDNFPLLNLFYFKELEIYMSPPGQKGATGSIFNMALTISSKEPWTPPVPFVSFSDVGTRWVWAWSTYTDALGDEVSQSLVTGSVFGTINFGDTDSGNDISYVPIPPSVPTAPVNELAVTADQVVRLDVTLGLPSLFIGGAMRSGDYIPIGNAFAYFFGGSGPATASGMNITTLQFNADPIGQNYSAQAEIIFGAPFSDGSESGWDIDLVLVQITLQTLSFYVDVQNAVVTGGISGEFLLIQDAPSMDLAQPRMLVSAEYPVQDPNTPTGWVFTGYLYPGTAIDLIKLVTRFLNINSTSAPIALSVDALNISFATGSQAYALAGTISARWCPNIFGTELSVNASASIAIQRMAGQEMANGTLSGSFSVNKIALMASMDVGVPEPTYLFKVQFEEVWLQATTAWRGDTGNRHQVVSIQLGGITLGDMLEYLVNLAAPTIGFRLDSPWDALKQVNLSRFVLTIDPQENSVEFVFNANVDLVIAQLNSIGVRYTKEGAEGKVDLILTGSFLGNQYTDDKPLSWDVINDPPPAVPGQGISLVDLRYIGLGQRVTFKGPTPDTVAESIQKLKSDMTEPPATGDPMPQTMQYSSDSQWLIGLDIQLMETIDLGFIFNDPKLYGLSIALGGEKAGSLAGLRFEILYKKITNDIGMFRVEFQVPDMFRTIQLGVVSITLGIIVVEIYTNGNFKIDLGFPYDRNFDRSFSLQASIFIGRGGFYFGVLNGDTSTQVPRISNGNFSPVIELGIGIAAGVGREIKAGILSGGAYVELEVIFQGVLAWFNPNSSGAAPATYFKCQGIAALHGKIYGSVDFVVIKVSITLEAYAQISILYECYQPMQISMIVAVKAQASIKILFIRVHFSFQVKLQIAFTVGSAKPTPWILNNNISSGSSSQALQASRGGIPTAAYSDSNYVLRANKHRRMLAMRQAHYATMPPSRSLKAEAGTISGTGYILDWQPSQQVFSDSPRNAHLTLLPLFTIADVPVNWDGTVPANSNPNYRTAFVLFADSGISTSAVTAADCVVRSSAHSAMTDSDTDTRLLAADIFTQGLVLYAINSLPRDSSLGNTITAAQIELLLEQLDLPETMSDGMSVENLTTFFSTNIHLWISGDTDPRPDEKSAMVIPMPPFLRWTSPQTADVDFATRNVVGAWYEWGISQILEAYLPVGQQPTSRPADDVTDTYESFTSFMFRDFCLMIIQNAVKEMQTHLDSTTVTVETVSGIVQNLEAVAATLPTAYVPYTICSGDTIENVAESLGATVQELEFLNPDLVMLLQNEPVGTVLTIALGIAPEVLASDNPDQTFAINQCLLGTIVHQAAQEDTLKQIATLFNVADVATLLSYQDPAYPALSSEYNILQANSTFDQLVQTYSNAPADFDQVRTAAVFFVRYIDLDTVAGTTVPDMGNWYAQAIAQTTENQEILQKLFPNQTIPSDIELPPNYPLSVPNLYNADYQASGNRNTYTTVSGDTLSRIGYALTLQQDYPDTSPEGVPGWQPFKSTVTIAGAGSWTIPSYMGIVVGAGATIESLVRRLITNATWISSGLDNPSSGIWTYDWTSVESWIAEAKVLMPLASVTVPNAKTDESDDLSFTVLLTTYGLTVTDAAARLKAIDGLYASGTVLLVKSLPAQDIDVLVDAILQGDSFVSIVNQSSRMLLSGLQLPGLENEDGHVVPDTANPLPLYDLTGQQFSLNIDSALPNETALSLALYSKESWIELFGSITVQDGQTLTGLEAIYPDLLIYNPGLNEETFKVGMVLLTAPVASLDYSYTNQEILDASPASGLAILPVPNNLVAPSILPISGTVPRTYGLDHRIELQAPFVLPIPPVPGQAKVTGNPGMWMLPAELLAKAQSGVDTLYEILAAPQGADGGSVAMEIENSTFGTLIPFNVKRLNDTSSEFNLVGVDTDKRALLLSLSNWLRDQGDDDTTKAYLMLSPSPDATNTSGLTILSADAADSFLIKTNLSTLSVPPSLAMKAETTSLSADENAPVYYSNLASLADFLVLLWEGSVVGGTGYYFDAGQDLPGSAFDQQGMITLQLLVIVGVQQDLASDGRNLLPFNNCALIGTGVDSSSLSLFIQSAGSTEPAETVVQALVPPGNVGFALLTANPETLDGSYTDQEILLKTFYSLLSFEVLQITGSPFYAPASGMPVLPDPTDGSTAQPWEKARASRKARRLAATEEETSLPYWNYTQVLPVSRFILASTPLAAADVYGLPPTSGDPYQGYGTQVTLPSATFAFSFGDVLGNRTGTNGTNEGVTVVPVGYTDNLVAIGDWPSITRYFNVTSSDLGTLLSAVIGPRSSELLPTPSQRGDVNQDVMTQQQQQFSQVYYQLIQPGLTGWLVSSLEFIPDPDYINKGSEISDISPLWKFAAGAYAVASGLVSLPAAKPVGAATLGDIITLYGVRYTELAQANADSIVQELFTELPAVPAYAPFLEYQSVTKLYALASTGWPKPASASGLLELPENTSLPLRPGTALFLSSAKNLSSGPTQPTASLQELADSKYTSVSDLAGQNATLAMLEVGFEFVIVTDESTEVVVTVDASTNSLILVANAFATQGVQTTAAGLADMHRNETGMLAISQILTFISYIVQQGDTLETNNSLDSVVGLANANADTPNIFDPGALVYFGDFAGVTAGTTPVSLQQFADRYACPVELLLNHNSTLAFPASGTLVLPGTMAWTNDPGLIRVPYTIRTGDTLDAVAPCFSFNTTSATAQLQLATMNEQMPGTILPDIDILIQVDGIMYEVNTGTGQPSFASVMALLQVQAPTATLQNLVDAIAELTGILYPGGLFMCPLVAFSQVTTPAAINGLYGVSAGAFALANSAMQHIIAPGVSLQSPDQTQTVVTQTNDTFNSLITRFADQGIAVSANEIVDANPTAPLIQSGATAFIPPAEISFTASIPATGPYAGPIVPLQTSVRILRPEALIYPDFKTVTGTGPVEMAESDFPAPSTATSADSGLNFNVFIQEMKTALPELRIGTGQVNGVAQDLWQVNFNSNGIKKVALVGPITVNGVTQPRFFALKPLYQHLVTRTLAVSQLQADGTLGEPQDISFQNIDAELWARRFVEDMDHFLSGSYTMAIYNTVVIRDQLTTVINAKNTLIPAIAAGLDAVLDISDTGSVAGLESATDALEHQLGVSLAKTYEATVLVQYESTVDSVWQADDGLLPASLYGDGSVVNTLDGTPAVPGLTMISAKTHLDLADSYVNFLMLLDNPEFHQDISGKFHYAISNLEFNISDENIPDNYTSSDWLTFVPLQEGTEKPPALTGTDPGDIDVPIPLRTFPDMPRIVSQQVLQSFPDGSKSVGQLALWDYYFVYSHQHAEQDYAVISVQFNLKSPKMRAMAAVVPRDLFTELAQYMAVVNPLWNLLNGLTDPGDPTPAIENAVRTFATLATNIGTYWSNRLPQSEYLSNPTDVLVPGLEYRFNARVQYRGQDIDTYTLRRLTTEPGPNNTWPGVAVQLPSGDFLQMDVKSEAGDTRIYSVPADIAILPAPWPVFQLKWESLNLANVQNARSQLHVERNQELIEGTETNPNFTFSTNEVVAPSVVTPLNSFGERVDITDLGDNLTEALNTCFNDLFGSSAYGQRVTIEMAYGFELVPPSSPLDQGLVTYLPIGLYPNQELSATTAGDLNTVIEEWRAANQPSEAGGEWTFSLKLYSQYTDSSYTLLNIGHLVYRINQV
jgi:hypothetical protein